MRFFAASLLILVLLSASAGSGGVYAAGAPEAAPSPAGASTEVLKFVNPALFVVVLGKDDVLKPRIAVAMAKELGEELSLSIVPEGDWSLSDYIAQCKADPNAAGAFIVLPPGSGTKQYDWLVLLRDAVSVEFNAMISTCPQFRPGNQVASPTSPSPPEIAWVSQTVTGEFGRSVLQFLPFAVLTSVYLAFAPQRTYQTVTTHVIPTPNPLPPGGANTNVQTTNSTVLNASGTSSLQNSIVTSVAAATLNFGKKGDANHLTLHAAEDAAGQFLGLLQNHCGERGAHTTADDATFCSWLHPFVNGSVTSNGSASVGTAVLLQSYLSNVKDRSTIKEVRTDSLGHFHFGGLRPGSYVVSSGQACQSIEVTQSGDGSRHVVDLDIASPAGRCP